MKISIVVFLLLLAGLIAAVILSQRRQEIRKKAGNDQATVRLAAAKNAVDLNEVFNVVVWLELPTDGSLKVSAASLIIKYPADKLTLLDAVPIAGQFFMKNFPVGNIGNTPTEMLNIIDTATAGTAKITLGAPCAVCSTNDTCKPGQPCCVCYPESATGQYANLRFRAKAAGAAAISVETGSEAAAVNHAASVLVLTGTATTTIIINGPTATAVTNTPVPTSVSTVTLKVKFQGIESNKGELTAKVTVKQGATVIKPEGSIPFFYDGAGTYKSAPLTGIPQGAYDIYVKGFSHLTEKWAENILLLAGDANGDNAVGILDYNMFNNNDLRADFDKDGSVNLLDYAKIQANFDKKGKNI